MRSSTAARSRPRSQTPQMLPEQALESARKLATLELDPAKRGALGQYMTPWPVARFMASLFASPQQPRSRLLDAGAGVGSLTAAFVDRWTNEASASAQLSLTAVELDSTLHRHVLETFALCSTHASGRGKEVDCNLLKTDFLVTGTDWLLPLCPSPARFTHAILNPPYLKINNGGLHRRLLSEVGIETVNMYTAFIAVAVALLVDGGELVAIIPRSWCNGAYYKPFRQWMARHAAMTHIHLFESRKKAFKEDDVLQENVIVRWVRSAPQGNVIVSGSSDSTFSDYHQAEHPFSAIVHADDSEQYVHIPLSALQNYETPSPLFTHSLSEIGIDASTGPVVDFRLREHLRQVPEQSTVPLLYPQHFKTGALAYPSEGKKPNAIALNSSTQRWLYPSGWYVITKRFSAKEERRRIVAHVIDPSRLPGKFIGFENHVNVFHADHAGIDPDLAHGLALFLNSTVVDDYFRLFSGHTQVNVTDLRRMRFPSRSELVRFGKWARKQKLMDQTTIDKFLGANV